MARANIPAAVDDLRALYGTVFGGKSLGRFTLSRDQLAELLRIKVAQDKTIAILVIAVFEDADLVLGQCGPSLYSVVSGRKARRWRKVSRRVLGDLIGASAADGADDDDGEPEEGDD